MAYSVASRSAPATPWRAHGRSCTSHGTASLPPPPRAIQCTAQRSAGSRTLHALQENGRVCWCATSPVRLGVANHTGCAAARGRYGALPRARRKGCIARCRGVCVVMTFPLPMT
ncbi:hypothetical protein BC834DRAFT_904897 [Gloeopeniophorella convolvens]|nr:hypothetical protein BC834DRAFT_904897 [Gloeopeniophorella convolvens]